VREMSCRSKGFARCVQKEREPIHIYRVTDNTQIGQMSEDTRGTQFRGVVETLLWGKGILWKGRHRMGVRLVGGGTKGNRHVNG